MLKSIFNGRIRDWNKSDIVLMHLLSLFTPVNRIYKINKNIKKHFTYFFNSHKKQNPLKDEIYELQKNISDDTGQHIKESLLRYYHDNNFLDLSLTFIDGHVIAYFGKESFQKLKHSTRNKIIKSLEVFNFSDKRGRIFYFRADHDVEGMQKNIESLINDVNRIIGLDKVKILVFDRGGSSQELFHKLHNKYNLKFITLVVKSEKIQKQIDDFCKSNKFKKLKGKKDVQYLFCQLNIGKESFRTLLIKNKDSQTIYPFITNMKVEELSNTELLEFYSMHWNQEQEHNAFGKIGGNMHSKVLQDSLYPDTTKIQQKSRIKNKINKVDTTIVKLNNERKRLNGLILSLESKIKPKSKQTDNKTKRKQILDYNSRIKQIINNTDKLKLELTKLKYRLNRIQKNPQKKKFKNGPVDYSISITNLANNLSSRLIEIATRGKEKYQLATLLGSLYQITANISEDNNYIYVEYFNMRQKKQVKMIVRLCDYFNPCQVRLRGKILKFSVKLEK